MGDQKVLKLCNVQYNKMNCGNVLILILENVFFKLFLTNQGHKIVYLPHLGLFVGNHHGETFVTFNTTFLGITY